MPGAAGSWIESVIKEIFSSNNMVYLLSDAAFRRGSVRLQHPPGNEVNAVDTADTVQYSPRPSSFKHQIHLQPSSTLPSNPNSQKFLVFSLFPT